MFNLVSERSKQSRTGLTGGKQDFLFRVFCLCELELAIHETHVKSLIHAFYINVLSTLLAWSLPEPPPFQVIHPTFNRGISACNLLEKKGDNEVARVCECQRGTCFCGAESRCYTRLRSGQDLEEGWRVFFQDQMGGSNMSAEPDSGDHLYAAAKAELNTHAAAVTLDSGQQIFFFFNVMVNSNCSGISFAFTSPR